MNHFILFYFISLFSSLLVYSNGDKYTVNGDKYTVVDTRYSKHKESLLCIDSNRLDSHVLEDTKRLSPSNKVDNTSFYLQNNCNNDQLRINMILEEKRFDVLDLYTDNINDSGSLRDLAERLFLIFYKKGIFHEFESDLDNINILMVINPTVKPDSEPKFLSDIQNFKGKESLEWLEAQIGKEAIADSGIIFIINNNGMLKFIPISLNKTRGL